MENSASVQVFFFIYKTTNLINNMIYVGQHGQYETSAFDGYLGSGKIIKQAIKKNGRENFIREIIEHVNMETINEREIYWIAELSATNPLIGYNLTSGGENAPHYKGKDHYMYGKSPSEETIRKIREWNTGKHHTQETRMKMSNAHKGKIRSEQYKRNISKSKIGKNNPNYGKTISEETRIKMSKAHKGIKPRLGMHNSEEHKRKIGEAQLGRHHSEESKIKMRKPKSEEAIKNMTIARRNRKHTIL